MGTFLKKTTRPDPIFPWLPRDTVNCCGGPCQMDVPTVTVTLLLFIVLFYVLFCFTLTSSPSSEGSWRPVPDGCPYGDCHLVLCFVLCCDKAHRPSNMTVSSAWGRRWSQRAHTTPSTCFFEPRPLFSPGRYSECRL